MAKVRGCFENFLMLALERYQAKNSKSSLWLCDQCLNLRSFSTFWVKISQNGGSQKGPYFLNQEGPFWIQGSHNFKSQEQPLKMELSDFESQKPDHEYRTLADLKRCPRKYQAIYLSNNDYSGRQRFTWVCNLIFDLFSSYQI